MEQLQRPAEESSSKPVLDYRQPGEAAGALLSRKSFLLVPHRVVVLLLRFGGCLAILISLTMDAHLSGPFGVVIPMRQTFLMAIGSLDALWCDGSIVVGCASAVLLTVILSVRRTRLCWLWRITLAMPPLLICLATLAHGAISGITFFHGFYIAATGCVCVSGSILMDQGWAEERAHRLVWCVRIDPLRRLEIPPIHIHRDGPHQCCFSEPPPNRLNRAAGRRAWRWALLATLCWAAPMLYEFYCEHMTKERYTDVGIRAWGIALLLFPAVLVFSAVGLASGVTALITPPRMLLTALATLICAILLLRFTAPWFF